VNVTCQDCRSVFRVDPAKVPPNGVRARCSVCGAIVRIAVGATTPLTNTSVPRPLTPLQSPAVGGSARPTTPVMADPVAAPLPYPSRPTPSFSSTGSPTPAAAMWSGAAPIAEPPTTGAGHDGSITPSAPLAPLEFLTDAAGEAPVVTPPAVAAPDVHRVAGEPAASEADTAVGVVPGVTPVSAGAVPVTPRPLVPPPPPSPGQLVGMPEPPPAALAPVAAVTTEPRRVINPFLRSDPMTRAKRLARALVSDMVAYQPAKRADGLANGTLKQLFRDEIRKSYDEYVEQVGREVAESTAFFQDALNEVLAEGKRVF
jgi:predicted Zn finger-like uncharacterized protein